MEEERYEYLNDIIKDLIDNYIKCERDEIDDTQIRKVKLSSIENFNLDEDEVSYIIKGLGEEDIIVIGSSEVIYSDYNNYKYSRKGYSKYNYLKSTKLTNSEQIELLKEYRKTNDKKILEKLVSSYSLLIKSRALKYSKLYGVELGDLENTGYEALLNAFSKYDFSKNALISYVEKSIKGSILKSIQSSYGINHYSDYHIFLNARNEVKNEHYGETGYNEYEHIDEIAELFLENSTRHDKFKDIRMTNMVYSLPLDEVADSIDVSDDVSLYENALEPLFQKQMQDSISLILEKSLTEKQRYAVINYYGLNNKDKLTMKEIADAKGCKTQAICNALNSSYERLLTNWTGYMADFYDNDNDEYGYIPGKIEYNKTKYKSNRENK